MTLRTFARIALGGAVLAEGGMALRRFEARRRAFEAAARRASALGRPLIVVGDPDAGTHTRLVRAYGCGDLCIDLQGCPMCRVMQAADLTAGPVPVWRMTRPSSSCRVSSNTCQTRRPHCAS